MGRVSREEKSNGGCKRVKLGEIAQVNPKAAARLSDDDKVIFLPLASVNVDGTISEGLVSKRGEVRKGHPYFRRGDILVAKITPSFENGKVALASISLADGYSSTEFHVVRADTEHVRPDYLLAFLRSPQVVHYCSGKMKGSAGQKRVPKEVLQNLQINLPPLSEQEALASRLNAVANSIRAAQTQVARFDSLVKARFEEMFGDPGSNQHEFKVRSLGDVLAVQPSNGLYKPQKDYVADGTGTPIIRIDSFSSEGPDFSSLKRLTCSEDERKRYGIAENDIVINRVNSVGCMGKTMLIAHVPEPTVYESNMMRLHSNEALMLPAFLCAQMTSDYSKNYFESNAKRAIGQASINQKDVKGLPVFVPPLDVQKKYLAFAQQVAKSRSIAQQQIEKLQLLYDSLAQEYFG